MEICHLVKSDFDRGFLETLESLRPVGEMSRERFEQICDCIAASHRHFILVAEQDDQIVGSLTLFFEQKFIHGGGLVAHIEDVVVRQGFQGNGVGKALVDAAIERATEAGCYKVILNCDEAAAAFYERSGFCRHEIEMRLDLPITKPPSS